MLQVGILLLMQVKSMLFHLKTKDQKLQKSLELIHLKMFNLNKRLLINKLLNKNKKERIK